MQRGIIETLIDKPMHALFASGSTFDVLTLSDFLAGKQDYRMVIFMNVFSPTAAQRQSIAARINRPGTMTVWGYAPGLVTPEGLNEKAMEELTGMKLGVIHERLPMQVYFPNGGSMASIRRNAVVAENPRVIVTDPAAEVLAKYTQGGQTAIAAKKLASGATAVVCGMPIQDPAVWAALFKRAGIHRYVNDRDVAVMGNERYLVVHTGKGGAVEVTLPRKAAKVVDLFDDREIASGAERLILRSPEGATWFLEITY